MSHPSAPAAPGASHAAPRSSPGWLTSTWLLVAVLVGTALAVAALPLAPVVRTTATVTWPVAGAPLDSTMLTLLPYRPLAMDVELPCDTVGRTPDDRVLFSTFPVGSAVGQGLTVTATGGRAEVVSEGTTVWRGPVRGTAGCALSVGVGVDRTRVAVDGDLVADAAVEPPRVAVLATALPPDTDGVSARLETDSRFESSPTTAKRLLIVLSLLGAALAVAALAAVDRRVARPARPPRAGSHAWPQDVVVAAVLGTWLLIGPMMADDGYNVAVANGFSDTGYVGNYHHWYNAPEAPFALVQQALVPLADLTRAPFALRVPALLAGLTTWLLLSRVLLPRLAGGRRTSTLRWIAVPVLLAWWLPFNNSLRPEPYVAVCGTAVLALVLLAVERRRVLLLAAAGVVAALSLAAAPSGLMAAAPLLVLSPRIVEVLRGNGVPWPLLGAVALVPAGVVAGVAVFADQPLGAVLEATRIHQVIGPAVPWWQDIVRYEFLFGTGEMGTAARRLAVLATLFSLVLVVFLRRSLRAGSDLVLTAASCYGIALVLLVLAPSKWTHHFGGGVGFAVLLVVGLAAHGAAALRQERAAVPVGAVASFVAAAVVAAGFAGPNVWWAYGSLGVDPQLPEELASPLLWLVAGGLAAVVLPAARTRGLPRPAAALASVPPTVVVLALAVSVVVVVGSHASAARELQGGWSMASQNLGHLTGDDCGMGDHLEVLVPTPLEARTTAGEEEQTVEGAFVRGAGSFLPGPGSLPAEALRWGTLGSLPGDPNAAVGTLRTPWFDVPDLAGGQTLGLVVSGRTSGENEVALEFADSDAPAKVLRSVRVAQELDGAYWQQVAILPDQVRGDLVRVVATDDTVDLGGWLAVSQPILVTPTPLASAAEGRAVHVDWTLRLAFPCLPQVPVAHGLAQLPDLVLTSLPRASAEAAYALALDEDQGGAFAMARQASAPEVLPTRLPFLSEEAVLRGQDLGTLSVWSYPYPRDRFRLELGRETVAGWQWGYRYPVPTVPDPLDPPGPRLVDKGNRTEFDSRPGVQPPEFAEEVRTRAAPAS